MKEKTGLYVDGMTEQYVVLGKDEHDVITNLSHYQGSQGLEVIEADKNFLAEEMLRSYYKGKILKYLLHEREKNGLEDLKKARKHLDWLIDLEEQ
jgi:hypothetical protein